MSSKLHYCNHTSLGPNSKGESPTIWRYVIFKVTPPKNEEEIKNPWLNLKIVSGGHHVRWILELSHEFCDSTQLKLSTFLENEDILLWLKKYIFE